MKKILTFLAVVCLLVGIGVAQSTPKPFIASVRTTSIDTALTDSDDTLVTEGFVRVDLPSCAGRVGKSFTIVAARAEYDPYSASGVELVPATGGSIEGAPNGWANAYSFGYGARIVRCVSATEWRVVAGW